MKTDIKSYINVLSHVLPYPMHWYDTLSDKQIEGIFRDNWDKVYTLLTGVDEEKLRRRMEKIEYKKGAWRIVCVNKCSLRFIYYSHTGKVIHGIIATYKTKGYQLSKLSTLGDDELCLTWQHGKQVIMPRTLLISKILASATNEEVRDVIRGINSLRRPK